MRRGGSTILAAAAIFGMMTMVAPSASASHTSSHQSRSDQHSASNVRGPAMRATPGTRSLETHGTQVPGAVWPASRGSTLQLWLASRQPHAHAPKVDSTVRQSR